MMTLSGISSPSRYFFHNLIIGFDSRFHHLAVSIGDPVLQFIRDFDFIGSIAVAAVGLLIEDVDDTTEILFLAQRQMERQHPFTNLGPDAIILYSPERVIL